MASPQVPNPNPESPDGLVPIERIPGHPYLVRAQDHSRIILVWYGNAFIFTFDEWNQAQNRGTRLGPRLEDMCTEPLDAPPTFILTADPKSQDRSDHG